MIASMASSTLSSDSFADNHPVSIVEAEVYVNRHQAIVRLTCFAEDLELLQGVEPLEDGKYDSAEIREATQDHGQYLLEKIRFLDINGEVIPGKITGVVDAELPEERAEAGSLMKYTIGFEMELKYDQPPEFLTIEQNMVAEGQLLPSELKVILKQAGSPTPYRRMLKPQTPETFRFDWDRPPLSEKDSQEEWDSWFAKQSQDTLGIESYSSVYSFIYINNAEVRNEVLIPLANLTALMEFERADRGFLSVEEQEPAAEQIRRFFSVGNPVRIDGIQIEPIFDRVDFYGLDIKDFAVQAAKRKVSMANGRVGIIMRYPAKQAPSKVEVTWDKFNKDSMRSIDGVALPYQDVEKFSFSMFLERNVYLWEATDVPQLPELNSVDLADPRYHVGPVTVGVPVVAVGCLGLGVLAIAGCFFSRAKWLCLVVAGVLGVSGALTTGVGQVQMQSPFDPPGQLDVSDASADIIFSQLHQNLFRSFDYTDESQVYDALACSVQGPLLRKLYLQVNDSLRISEQGGAVSRIEDVSVLSGNQVPDTYVENGFRYRCKWNIVGTIEHWGHIHERTNQYDALFDVQVVDGAWKILSMDILDQPQGVVKSRQRKMTKKPANSTEKSVPTAPQGISR